MNDPAKRRSFRSMDAVRRLREAEEHRVLRDVARGRESIASSESRLESLQRRIESSRRRDESTVRERLFAEILRGCAERIADELRDDRAALRELQDRYREVRSRRRVAEELRDRHVGEGEVTRDEAGR